MGVRSMCVPIVVEWPCRTCFFCTRFFPRFSENEVFAQCYFHDFRFICSLSLVIFHFRAVLFSRFFENREKRENITGAKKKHVLQYACVCCVINKTIFSLITVLIFTSESGTLLNYDNSEFGESDRSPGAFQESYS